MELVHITLPVEMSNKIQALSASQGIDSQELVIKAVNHYVELQQWQVDKITERLSQSRFENAVFYTHDDVEKLFQDRIS